MTESFTIADLRRERGETLEQFAETIGVKSKGHASDIERGVAECSLNVALQLEELGGGRLDAAKLNADVARARAAIQSDAA